MLVLIWRCKKIILSLKACVLLAKKRQKSSTAAQKKSGIFVFILFLWFVLWQADVVYLSAAGRSQNYSYIGTVQGYSYSLFCFAFYFFDGGIFQGIHGEDSIRNSLLDTKEIGVLSLDSNIFVVSFS